MLEHPAGITFEFSEIRGRFLGAAQLADAIVSEPGMGVCEAFGP
jgi:hypothetical protein